MTYVEVLLNHLLQEAIALGRVVDVNSGTGSSGGFAHPDFSGLMNGHVQAYIADPSLDNLKRLEIAINIAFLQLGIDGRTLLDRLKMTAVSEVKGQAFLTTFEDQKILLCHDLNRWNQELKKIQQEVFQLSNQARDLIKVMGEAGHTQERVQKLLELLDLISERTLASARITQLDRFNFDRHIKVVWNLESDSNEFDASVHSVRIEFIAFDGMFWIPSASSPLMNLMPAIADIATVKGSILPSGNGKLAALQTLSLTLRQSPYSACSTNNQEINMVVMVTDESGRDRHHVLTAKLDQL